MFVNLLNKIRKGEIDQNGEHIIKSRFVDKNDPHYLGDFLHIFTENSPVTRHNNIQFKQIPRELIKIQAKDQLPKIVTFLMQSKHRNENSQTGRLNIHLNWKSMSGLC